MRHNLDIEVAISLPYVWRPGDAGRTGFGSGYLSMHGWFTEVGDSILGGDPLRKKLQGDLQRLTLVFASYCLCYKTSKCSVAKKGDFFLQGRVASGDLPLVSHGRTDGHTDNCKIVRLVMLHELFVSL